MKNRSIVFSHHHGDHKPGDKVTVDEAIARKLVKAKRATYAVDTPAAPPATPTPSKKAAKKAPAAPTKK